MNVCKLPPALWYTELVHFHGRVYSFQYWKPVLPCISIQTHGARIFGGNEGFCGNGPLGDGSRNNNQNI